MLELVQHQLDNAVSPGVHVLKDDAFFSDFEIAIAQQPVDRIANVFEDTELRRARVHQRVGRRAVQNIHLVRCFLSDFFKTVKHTSIFHFPNFFLELTSSVTKRDFF